MYAATNVLGICRAEPPRPNLSLSPDIYQRVAAALEILN
jgi:hypothetical protein